VKPRMSAQVISQVIAKAKPSDRCTASMTSIARHSRGTGVRSARRCSVELWSLGFAL
jgi:hypothetical protein